MPAGPLRVALRSADGSTVLASAELSFDDQPASRFGAFADSIETLFWMDDTNWTEVTCELTPTTTGPGQFTVTFEPVTGERATVWADWVSVMPADNVGGWHKGFADVLTELPVRLLKWPGGCMADAYDWREGIGPRDSRHCAMDQAWLGWDENDVGIDEFMAYCALTGAEPMIGVNGGNGTPELAASWVEYCNGPADSEWGARRIANGHPEPYNIRYWVVGNEQWGHFERGYAGPEGYARRYLRIAEAMRKVDPSITLVAVGHVGEFNRTVLEIAGAHLDELQIHHYSPEVEVVDDETATAKIRTGTTYDEILGRIKDDIASVPGCEHVKVALDEWGWSRANHAGAVYIAATFNALHRMAPLVVSGARSCVVQADGVANRVGAIVEKQAAYESFRLYNQAWLPMAVAADVEGVALDVSCLVDPASSMRSVFLVNPEADAVTATVELDGVTDGQSVEVDRMVAPPEGVTAPMTVATTGTEPWSATWTLPPHSLTILRVD